MNENMCSNSPEQKHRGGQPGNQNACTHGFYSKAVPPELRQKLQEAETVLGLDAEIALLRAKISAASEDPSQSTFLLSGISLLSRLLRTRERLDSHKSKNMEQAAAGPKIKPNEWPYFTKYVRLWVGGSSSVNFHGTNEPVFAYFEPVRTRGGSISRLSLCVTALLMLESFRWVTKDIGPGDSSQIVCLLS
jgi:hypothetical protein